MTRTSFVWIRALVATLLLGVGAPAALATGTTGPSTTVLPYIDSHLPGVDITSLLTVDDGTVPKTGGGSTRLVGIPDGIGAIDGDEIGEPGFFYLLVNHELNSSQGVARDHGNAGAFVSKWKIDKTTLEVVEGDDLIKTTFGWDEGTSNFVAESTTFNRMCSSDRPAPTALFNSATGNGSQEIIYLNGEETSGGRAYAHVVTGSDAGNSYHLEHFGFLAFENVVLSPNEQESTVGVMLDDASNGEVYVYVGQKQSIGNEVEKAGLVGGDLYAIAVVGKPYELDNNLSLAVGDSEPFVLKLIGTAGDRPMNGSDTEARGSNTISPVDPAQTFESLKMGGPEDGAWDTRPGRENVFYFATKGTSSNGINAPTRLWQLEFDDIANPTGGTLTLLLDGPENRLGSLDNMGFDVVGGQGKVYLQEDLGGDARLSKIFEYDVATGQLEELAQHEAARFFEGGATFLTTNEESSGIVSLEPILGAGWHAVSIQAHSNTGLSNTGELVEHGQLLLMNVAGRGTDLLREPVVVSGDLWNYRVDGIDPGATWNDIGFAIDANWNVNTGGTPTGPAPTMLGYGEAAGALATDFGQPPTPRPATYYLRREFDLTNPSEIILFDLYMKADDGAVVYINDVEVARYNMAFDVADGNDVFASRNEPSERDWKQIPITGASLGLQATGNVIAVSMHQENDASSDLRMDLELIAWRESPDVGVAPVTPTGLAVSSATETTLTLDWNTQTDAKFFRIERQAAGDVAWGVIEDEYPGSFASYVDESVESGVSYTYRIWAVNIHGRSALSATASGMTAVSLIPTIFEEDFNIPDSLGQFVSVDVLEPAKDWSWVLWDFGSTGAVQGNNFGDGAGPTEDWLITQNPINFLFYTSETLEFDSQISFSGPTTLVQYSTDYDPLTMSDPNMATWTLIYDVVTNFGTLTKEGPFDISSIPDNAYLSWKYTGNGSAGGQSQRATFDDIIVKGECGFDFSGAEDGPIDAPWLTFNLGSELTWLYQEQAGQQSAINNNFGSASGGSNGTTTADDYLVSPPFAVDGSATIQFEYYERFSDGGEPMPLTVLVTSNWTGDPTTTAWTDITPAGLDGSVSSDWIPVTSDAFDLGTTTDARVAFRYRASGTGGGQTKRVGVDDICIQPAGGPLEAGFSFTRSGGDVTFVPVITGGTPPYQVSWDFGDGGMSSETGPTHTYTTPGTYTVTMTVTDNVGGMVVVTQTDLISVTQFSVPAPEQVRIAAFNTSMNRPSSGELATDLATGTDAQIQAVAETIQRANADVVLVNEYDVIHDAGGNFDLAATLASIDNFRTLYLEVPQAPDTSGVEYPFVYVAPSNTGIPSGFDLNNDGDTTDPNDAYGFGAFPGQFAMMMLSKYPIMTDDVRTFQLFRWVDMPNAFLPPDPNDSDSDGNTASYYNAAELDVFRLSSKSHWDVPVSVPGIGVVHLLASHPTPPVFDDGEAQVYPSPTLVDQNGLRNHDEIRFWADYIDPTTSGYIYDDAEWAAAGNQPPATPNGGLPAGARFVVLGDQNADPVDGDATFNPIDLLLSNALVDTSVTPTSAGALEQVPTGSNRETKTASFNLRADYVLPSVSGWDFGNAWVFWPLLSDLEADLLNASDHRMVVIDMVGGADTDGDGVSDALDNCVLEANPDQRDTDGDLIGNICDADFNNDCIVNVVDLGIMRSVFFTSDADVDLNGDGVVNVVDLGILRAKFFLPPGPSAAGCDALP